MNRAGQETAIKPIIFGVIALIILVIVFLLLNGNFGKFNLIAKLLPGLENEIPEGTSIIGLNLEDDSLRYYVPGNKWGKIDLDKTFFVLGNYEFVPTAVKTSLSNFYLGTERRPSTINLEVNSWRYWKVEIGHNYNHLLKITPLTKPGFMEKINEGTLFLNYFSDTQNGLDMSLKRLYSPLFVEQEKSGDVLGKAISWRDQILEGGTCEKLISLDIKQNGIYSSKKYAVRKIDEYILVDLSTPLDRFEKWTNTSCFSIESYKDEEVSINSPIFVTFNDGFLDDRKLTFTFTPENGWTLPDSSYSSGFIFKEKKYRYSISGANIRSLHLGLAELFKIGESEINSLIITTGENSNIVYKKQSFSKEELDNFGTILYQILDKYNKLFNKELNE